MVLYHSSRNYGFRLREQGIKFSEVICVITEDGLFVECKNCGGGHLGEYIEDAIRKGETGIVITSANELDFENFKNYIELHFKDVDYKNHLDIIQLTENRFAFYQLKK